jgi:hypothetical protein
VASRCGNAESKAGPFLALDPAEIRNFIVPAREKGWMRESLLKINS